jgi:hypothetical protein
VNSLRISFINPLINPRVYIHSTPVEYVLHPLCNYLKNRTSTLLGPKWSGCSGSDPCRRAFCREWLPKIDELKEVWPFEVNTDVVLIFGLDDLF